MSERAHEFKIGAFVLFGVALILAGLVAFAFSRDVEPVYHFETYVDGDVDGLSVGSSVKLRGVDVGQVTSIHFSWIDYPPGTPRCVVIRFTIAKSQSPIPVGGDEGGKLQEAVSQGLRAVVQGSSTPTRSSTRRSSSPGRRRVSTSHRRRVSSARLSPPSPAS